MAPEPLEFNEDYEFTSGQPLAFTPQFSYTNMKSNEQVVLRSSEDMSDKNAASFHTPIGDEDFGMSDVSSVLSEPPAELDLNHEPNFKTDLESALGCGVMSRSPSPYEDIVDEHLSQRPVLSVPDEDDVSAISETDSDGTEDESPYEDAFSDDDEHMSLSGEDESGPLEKFYELKMVSAVSDFENLPYELLSRIACLLPSDSDFMSLILTCHTFARQLQPENSSVWKTRFLQEYDHPIIEGPYEFRIAYQLRAMALPRFIDLGFGTRNNSKILLAILKDMVLETYNKPLPWHANPRTSLNMAAFADITNSNWMVHFLSIRLFARDRKHPYGRTPYSKLFDTLQVLFSYLVLNRSPMAFAVVNDKADYDLARVYNWNRPFALLYQRLSDKEPEATPPPSSLFPNLRRRPLP